MFTKKMRAATAALGIAALGLFAFSPVDPGSIAGTVSPADAATNVLAISGTDTLRADLNEGAFKLDAQPGTYQVVVEAAEPFQNVVKEGVVVKEGETTDLGAIMIK